MKVVVSIEHRFVRTPDGTIWSSGQFPYGFWERYLAVFGGVRIIARAKDVAAVPTDWLRSDGERVEFAIIPSYRGPVQFYKQYFVIRSIVRSAWQPGDSVIFRDSTPIGRTLEPLLQDLSHPYGVEVLGDPADMFERGAFTHPLRPLFRLVLPKQLKRLCAGAAGAAYVTKEALQRGYPCPAYSTHYSDVRLCPEDFRVEPRSFTDKMSPVGLVTVVSLSHPHKGVDILLDAVADCVRKHLDIGLTIVGGGELQPVLRAQAGRLGLEGKVCFAGNVADRNRLRNYLDDADLFVLASRHEGLPRAMVEAMARALPCLGSAVGGIPELLDPDALIPSGDPLALSAALSRVSSNPGWLATQSGRNLAKAQAFREEVLEANRTAFYRHIRGVTESWVRASSSS